MNWRCHKCETLNLNTLEQCEVCDWPKKCNFSPNEKFTSSSTSYRKASVILIIVGVIVFSCIYVNWYISKKTDKYYFTKTIKAIRYIDKHETNNEVVRQNKIRTKHRQLASELTYKTLINHKESVKFFRCSEYIKRQQKINKEMVHQRKIITKLHRIAVELIKEIYKRKAKRQEIELSQNIQDDDRMSVEESYEHPDNIIIDERPHYAQPPDPERLCSDIQRQIITKHKQAIFNTSAGQLIVLKASRGNIIIAPEIRNENCVGYDIQINIGDYTVRCPRNKACMNIY